MIIQNPEHDGERAGRRAAEKFKLAAAEGRPFNRVDAYYPSDIPALTREAEQMVASDSVELQRSGRFWLAYTSTFSKEI
ncbi:hypothetical protein [Bradyrhizobium brasilense]|uniref:hypothetical protein n=1 Tax=Bradyrhizobium brasilense TaxID=1419277 RepID=UPI00115FB5A8|nr:hypothetical protein [Bradyrhizobium brasilense]